MTGAGTQCCCGVGETPSPAARQHLVHSSHGRQAGSWKQAGRGGRGTEVTTWELREASAAGRPPGGGAAGPAASCMRE